MTRAGTRRAGLFVVLGMVVAAIVSLALWVRFRKMPADGSAPAANAANTGNAGAPRFGARSARPPVVRASIAGRVADPTGAPIGNATVCANLGAVAGAGPFEQGEPTCTPTGQDGQYQLKDLSPARFTLFASAPGHRPMGYVSPDPGRARFLDLREGEARTGVDITLPSGGVEARGQVKDMGGGAIAGARVTLNSWMGAGQGAAVTLSDAQGFFSAWVDEGPFIAHAAADGYADGFRDGVAPGPPVEILLTPGSVLVGRVVEAGTGAPVAGAKIDIGGDQGWGRFSTTAPQSKEDGRFLVAGLGPGRYKPSARISGGFGQARESVLLGIGETSAEVVIELHPAHDVMGRVEVTPGGGPCPSGSVFLMSTNLGGVLHAALDPDGRARFEGVLPGTYESMVNCPDHAVEPNYPRVEVKDTDVEGLVWAVRAGLSIRGRVVDREDKPVRAGVHAAPMEGGGPVGPVGPGGLGGLGGPPRPSAFTQSEEDGSFVLRGLLAGKHNVMANARSHVSPEPIEVDLIDERAPEVTIVVDAGGSIEGTVTDEDHRPVAGAEIMLMGQQPGTWGGPPVKSLSDGSFVQKGVAPGAYQVGAMKGGMPLRAPGQTEDGPPAIPVTVKAGATARVQIVVERQGGEISGRVVDASGGPVTDAFIEATREQEGAGLPGGPGMARHPMGGWSGSAVLTDPEGEFVVGNLGRGIYSVHAYRRGGGSGFVEHVKLGTTVTITIQQTGSIAGTVTVSGGPPPEQFTIRVVNHEAMFFRHESFMFTDGAFTIGDVPEGKFELSVDAPEGTATTELTLASGEQRSGVVLALAGRVSVKGQVVSLEGGAPVPGMSVQLFPQKGMAMSMARMENKVTDQAGYFEIPQVPAGAMVVTVMPTDPMTSEFDPVTLPADVQPGTVTDLGRILLAKRRVKMGEMPGDLGFSLKPSMQPTPYFMGGSLEVGAVLPGGPAAAADLRVGDMIVSVDGYDVTGKMGYLFGTLVSVPEGTRVTLGVARGASIAIVAAKMRAPQDMPPPPGGMPPMAPPPPPPPPPPSP